MKLAKKRRKEVAALSAEQRALFVAAHHAVAESGQSTAQKLVLAIYEKLVVPHSTDSLGSQRAAVAALSRHLRSANGDEERTAVLPFVAPIVAFYLSRNSADLSGQLRSLLECDVVGDEPSTLT